MSGAADRRRALLGAGLMLLALGVGCATTAPRTPAAHAASARIVRIGIAGDVASMEVRVHGGWELQAGGERRTLGGPAALRFAALSDRIVVTLEDGSQLADANALELEPRSSQSRLEHGKTPYRGRFRVQRTGSKLVLVDELDLEEYLRGVVTWEIGRLGPEARSAVEAQAVAARTYTLTRLGQFEAQGFDLWGDERDQVFKGATREDPVADAAIAATRGLVLEQDGKLAQAYYSSTCGGHTSWIEHVWPKPAQPYLRGRRDAGDDGRSYCAASRHFRWTEAWSGAELERILQTTLPRVLGLPAGTAIGGLLDLRVLDRDASARVLALEVRTTTGTYTVRGDSIRWALRPSDRPLLRSLMFDLEVERAGGAILRCIVRGGGNGHGVGMCQHGAIGMARRGFDVEAILRHYYPGATIERAD